MNSQCSQLLYYQHEERQGRGCVTDLFSITDVRSDGAGLHTSPVHLTEVPGRSRLSRTSSRCDQVGLLSGIFSELCNSKTIMKLNKQDL